MNNLWLWFAILFNILTNIGFKYASLYDSHPAKKWTIFTIALVFGLLNSVCFTEALKTVSLNTASAVFFSLTIVGLFLFSYIVFHEGLSWMRVAGTFVICAGVIMINLN
jgi:multidrug transporter EmrE-like cation transporter